MKKILFLLCLSVTSLFHSCLGISPLSEDESEPGIQTETPSQDDKANQTASENQDDSPDFSGTENPDTPSDFFDTENPDTLSDLTGTENPDTPSDFFDTENPDTLSDLTGTENPGEASVTSAPERQTALSALHVDGAKLVDASGTPVQLRGVSTHGLSWFPEYVNEDCFGELQRDWNVNVVRLAMYTAEYNGYCTGGSKEDLKNLIRDGVRYATNQNMYVIIDWHILSDGNPNQYLADAKEFWDDMSTDYGHYDNVLFEICNEPNGGASWEDVKSYADEIIPVIRGNGAQNVILVGTPNWSQEVMQAAADPLSGYENIMYTLHFYAATHKDDLRQKLSDAVQAHLPVFVSEFGICDASGNGAIDTEQADTWLSLLDSYEISYVAWNLSNKEESSALLKSGCSKTSGFTTDDLSTSGRWLYDQLRAHAGT